MSQEEETLYCPVGHSNEIYNFQRIYIGINIGYCNLCNKEHFSREFGAWSNGNVEIDKSCFISRSIHTLHRLYNSLEDIKSGTSQDPNLLKSNETSISSVKTYYIDSKELQECIDWEKEIQSHAKKKI
ncbi:8174_t:CDS:2 [Diversispora eburnea]|uniref:8174_t:CDS:1 n=1 Tax=Diversispora eburnea TaxID=1213867 RepID=A0A9N9F5F9_9GLOM|nr:8174_t:CDS:2 [Diversispora eburnea]